MQPPRCDFLKLTHNFVEMLNCLSGCAICASPLLGFWTRRTTRVVTFIRKGERSMIVHAIGKSKKSGHWRTESSVGDDCRRRMRTTWSDRMARIEDMSAGARAT